MGGARTVQERPHDEDGYDRDRHARGRRLAVDPEARPGDREEEASGEERLAHVVAVLPAELEAEVRLRVAERVVLGDDVVDPGVLDLPLVVRDGLKVEARRYRRRLHDDLARDVRVGPDPEVAPLDVHRERVEPQLACDRPLRLVRDGDVPVGRHEYRVRVLREGPRRREAGAEKKYSLLMDY